METDTASFSATVDAPINRVWDLVSDFLHLDRWHPMLESCEPAKGGDGITRLLNYPNLWVIEKLTRIDHAARFLEYCVVDSCRAGLIDAEGAIRLAPEGSKQTRVTLEARPNVSAADAAQIRAQLQAGLPVRMDHLRSALETEAASSTGDQAA